MVSYFRYWYRMSRMTYLIFLHVYEFDTYVVNMLNIPANTSTLVIFCTLLDICVMCILIIYHVLYLDSISYIYTGPPLSLGLSWRRKAPLSGRRWTYELLQGRMMSAKRSKIDSRNVANHVIVILYWWFALISHCDGSLLQHFCFVLFCFYLFFLQQKHRLGINANLKTIDD